MHTLVSFRGYFDLLQPLPAVDCGPIRVVPVRGPDVTMLAVKLRPARAMLRRDELFVEEHAPPRVSEVVVSNHAKKAVLLTEGQQLRGGMQDRVVARTVIVGPATSVPLEVRCVEASRWSFRRGEPETLVRPRTTRPGLPEPAELDFERWLHAPLLSEHEQVDVLWRVETATPGRGTPIGLGEREWRFAQHSVRTARLHLDQRAVPHSVRARILSSDSQRGVWEAVDSFSTRVGGTGGGAAVSEALSATERPSAPELPPDTVGVLTFRADGVGYEGFGCTSLFREAWRDLFDALTVDADGEPPVAAPAPLATLAASVWAPAGPVGIGDRWVQGDAVLTALGDVPVHVAAWWPR